jgi:hypothetical protein
MARSFAIRLCAALAAPCAARAETIFQFEPAISYDDNVTRAHDTSDVRSDQNVSLAASGSQVFAVSGRDLLSLGLNLKETQYLRFHGLSAFEAGPMFGYRHKFGLGSSAPWLSATAAWTYDDYVSHIRDGNHLLLQLAAGTRLNNRLDGALGLAYDYREAQGGQSVVPGISGRVFNLHGGSVFLKFGYTLSPAARAGLKIGLRRGLVESTARPGPGIYAVSDAIAEDTLFGEDFYAYRLKGNTISAGSNLSWALGPRSSLNLSGGFDHTSAGRFQYDGGTAGFSFVYRR